MVKDLVLENIRLQELLAVVELNKKFYEEFLSFMKGFGYESIYGLVSENENDKMSKFLNEYFEHDFNNVMYDGIARPYNLDTSKWYFISWLLRDAPQQRLQPIVSKVEGDNIKEKRITVINHIRKFVVPLIPDHTRWEWPAISEVMLHRLEGSRRAIKGGLFENLVRLILKDLFKKYKLNLVVTDQQVKIDDETYDVEIIGKSQKILMPVKTRETMGGGHALLFTRDIHKSISIAQEKGLLCIPVVIAESWTGKLEKLPSHEYIYIPLNPNQLDKIKPILESKLESLVSIFREIQ